MSELLDPTMSWSDVDRLRKIWKGPLIIKGILHPDEAKQALVLGVDSVIVSNHGGRQLDGAAASIEALPAIVEAVAGRIPVLIDGGIRRGSDVVKALSLGAACCLIARPQLWALRSLEKLELRMSLKFCAAKLIEQWLLWGFRALPTSHQG